MPQGCWSVGRARSWASGRCTCTMRKVDQFLLPAFMQQSEGSQGCTGLVVWSAFSKHFIMLSSADRGSFAPAYLEVRNCIDLSQVVTEP